jgi:chromosomal replication initiator protein
MTITQRLTRLEKTVEQLQRRAVDPPVEIQADLLARKIKALVASHFGISIRTILSRCRDERTVWPRFIAIYLIRKYTRLSSTEIGTLFRRDHGSILSAIHALEARIETSRIHAAEFNFLDTQFSALIHQ